RPPRAAGGEIKKSRWNRNRRSTASLAKCRSSLTCGRDRAAQITSREGRPLAGISRDKSRGRLVGGKSGGEGGIFRSDAFCSPGKRPGSIPTPPPMKQRRSDHQSVVP